MFSNVNSNNLVILKLYIKIINRSRSIMESKITKDVDQELILSKNAE